MPETAELRSIREHIAATHPRLQRLVSRPSFKKHVGTLDGEQLTRVPRGYRLDHPAAHYLRYTQFLAGCEYEATFALSPRFYGELLAVFRAVAPVIRFLNTPLEASLRPAPTPMDEDMRRRPRRAGELPPPPAPMW
jgi:uncharacterized protein (DUF2461 family)